MLSAILKACDAAAQARGDDSTRLREIYESRLAEVLQRHPNLSPHALGLAVELAESWRRIISARLTAGFAHGGHPLRCFSGVEVEMFLQGIQGLQRREFWFAGRVRLENREEALAFSGSFDGPLVTTLPWSISTSNVR